MMSMQTYLFKFKIHADNKDMKLLINKGTNEP